MKKVKVNQTSRKRLTPEQAKKVRVFIKAKKSEVQQESISEILFKDKPKKRWI